MQALPFVNEALDRGGEAGDVIVNLHAQLNMLGGLMMLLAGLALGSLQLLGARWPARRARLVLVFVPLGVAAYYVAGVSFSAVEAHRVAAGRSFAAAVSALEPWESLVLVPAALAVLIGFAAFASAAWRMTERQRVEGRQAIAAVPRIYSGTIPRRVRRRSPAALAGYELPLGLMGFPGVGWLFAGFPLMASILLMAGPALTWAIIPVAFSPYGRGPLRGVGWRVELVWLPVMAVVSSAALYWAQARRRARLDGRPPRGRTRRVESYRTRVIDRLGVLALLLVAIPFVPAVAGVGGSTVRYSYEPRLTNGGDRPVREHDARAGQALQLERSADVVPAGLAPPARVADRLDPRPRGRRRLGERVPALRPRPPAPGSAPPAHVDATAAGPRSRARAGSRAATRSSPPTRACSEDGTSPTSRSSRPALR